MMISFLRQVCIVFVICFLTSSFSQAYEYEHLGKGDLFRKQGKLQEAKREYEKEISENPHLVDAYHSLGYLYQHELKNVQKAIEVYLKGLKIEPNNYGLNLNIMYAYFNQGDINNGIKHYKLLANIRPENRRYSFSRKIIYKILKDMSEEEILIFCKKYLLMNPTDTMLREILVDIYKEQRDYKKAEFELKMMLKYGRKSSSVYFDLGTCNYNLGRPKKALEYFLLAKQLGAYVPKEFLEKLHKEIKESSKGNGVGGKEVEN